MSLKWGYISTSNDANINKPQASIQIKNVEKYFHITFFIRKMKAFYGVNGIENNHETLTGTLRE